MKQLNNDLVGTGDSHGGYCHYTGNIMSAKQAANDVIDSPEAKKDLLEQLRTDRWYSALDCGSINIEWLKNYLEKFSRQNKIHVRLRQCAV